MKQFNELPLRFMYSVTVRDCELSTESDNPTMDFAVFVYKKVDLKLEILINVKPFKVLFWSFLPDEQTSNLHKLLTNKVSKLRVCATAEVPTYQI